MTVRQFGRESVAFFSWPVFFCSLKSCVPLVASLVLLCGAAQPAAAVVPPALDPGDSFPADSGPAPAAGMHNVGGCIHAAIKPGAPVPDPLLNQANLDLSQAWLTSRGKGQTVAIIDTGVTPGPHLPHLKGGGDYLTSGDGLADCDGHGTAVAGLIGAQGTNSNFSGIAPDADLLSIRVTSQAFTVTTSGSDPVLEKAQVTVDTLAKAIVHAANSGASVIVIPTIICFPVSKKVDQRSLGAAVHYASVTKNAVIIAAAGDIGVSNSGNPVCSANPLGGLAHPHDPRNYEGVTNYSLPSYWQPYVLSVGATTATGQPSHFSMPGPWVGIAAPGENIVSLGNSPGQPLADSIPNPQGVLEDMNGSGYAAAYVAGVAALVRAAFPALTSAQIRHRLITSAHNGARLPANVVGFGTIDPIGALTWNLPAGDPAFTTPVKSIAAPIAPKDYPTPRYIALAVTGFLALLGVLTVAALGWHKLRAAERTS